MSDLVLLLLNGEFLLFLEFEFFLLFGANSLPQKICELLEQTVKLLAVNKMIMC